MYLVSGTRASPFCEAERCSKSSSWYVWEVPSLHQVGSHGQFRPSVSRYDRGVQKSGMFAQTLSAPTMCLWYSVVEAAEQIGRCASATVALPNYCVLKPGERCHVDVWSDVCLSKERVEPPTRDCSGPLSDRYVSEVSWLQ